MFTYKILLDPTGYTLIEADYFYVTKDTLGNRDACFCVVYIGEGESPQIKTTDETAIAATTGKEVLVGYVRNPVSVQLDTVYEAKPYSYQKSWAMPGMASVDGNINLDILHGPVYRG